MMTVSGIMLHHINGMRSTYVCLPVNSKLVSKFACIVVLEGLHTNGVSLLVIGLFMDCIVG